jgi:hypothetical protein
VLVASTADKPPAWGRRVCGVPQTVTYNILMSNCLGRDQPQHVRVLVQVLGDASACVCMACMALAWPIGQGHRVLAFRPPPPPKRTHLNRR